MPTRPVPLAFWLLLVFGLLGAGILALVGFAINDAVSNDVNEAVAGSQEAADELISAGLFPPEESDQAAPTEPPAGGDDLPADGDLAQGQQLFFESGCNICHGDTGGGGIGPKIAGTSLSLAEVTGQYRNPSGTMPSFPADRVPDQSVAHIYAWLQTLE